MDAREARATELRLEARLNEVQQQLEEAKRTLRDKASAMHSPAARAAVEGETYEHIAAVQRAAEEARAKFETMREQPYDEWDRQLPGLEAAWQGMSEALASVQGSASKH